MSVGALEPIEFSISRVEHGWLFAELNSSGQHIELANSYLGGQEAPGALLRALTDLLSGCVSERWLCWYGESCSYIWQLHSEEELLSLKIFLGGCSFYQPVQGTELEREAGNRPQLFEGSASLPAFALSVCGAFGEYSYGEKAEQWQNSEFKNCFPAQEYHVLRRMLRSRGCK